MSQTGFCWIAGRTLYVTGRCDPFSGRQRRRSAKYQLASGPLESARSMLLIVPVLVFTAFAIVLGAFAWGWANDSLVETPQERFDHQFELIVRHLSR